MSQGKARRVLVVDDDEGLLDLYEMVLAPFALEVRRATNGRDAVEKGASFNPHLVLLDIDLPVMGGVEAMRQLRKTAPRPAPRVVLVSASAASAKLRRQLEDENAAPDAYLAKPFDVSELVAIVRRLLGMDPTGRGASSALLAEGEKLGDFAAIRRVATWPGASVYAARQESLGRAAFLVVAPAHDEAEREASRWLKTRAIAQAKAACRGALRVLDQGSDGGMRYAALQAPVGPSLAELLDAGLHADARAALFWQASGIVAALAANGVERVRVEPESIWATTMGWARLGMLSPGDLSLQPGAALARLFDILAGANGSESQAKGTRTASELIEEARALDEVEFQGGAPLLAWRERALEVGFAGRRDQRLDLEGAKELGRLARKVLSGGEAA